MRYRHPARTGRDLSVIGFGAWQLGNEECFGPMDDAAALELVGAALEQGVNVFDTAPGYGRGNSERLLGMALENVRSEVFITTKFGHGVDNVSDFSERALEPSLMGSLDRLRTRYVDGLLLHNPDRALLDGNAPLHDSVDKLRRAGRIRHYGVSIDTCEELEAALAAGRFDIIEIMFNIVAQGARPLLERVAEAGMLLLIKVPLDSGWLTGKYTAATEFEGIRTRWTRADIETRLAIVDSVREVLERDDIGRDSLRFVLAHDAVTSVIPGVRNTLQLAENVRAQERALEPEKVRALHELYDTRISRLDVPW